jgi:uncharacterized membrane protein
MAMASQSIQGQSTLQSYISEKRAANGRPGRNVGEGERLVSGLAGSILVLQGLGRRDLTGLLIGGIGGALIHRGVTGHCKAYQALGQSTAAPASSASNLTVPNGIHIAESLLVSRSPDDLYAEWSQLENLPRMMTHLKSVTVIDETRSHWVAEAPALVGGQIEWDAEIVRDIPGRQLSWVSLPGSPVENAGRVRFSPAPGDRGSIVSVELDYRPPAGKLGHWVAKLFGTDAEKQIHHDLRNFKRTIEVGEVLKTDGQPHGQCMGLGAGRVR